MPLSVKHILILSIALRVGFFLFGLYQDAYMTVKYTDIDYLVFTDAARYVNEGLSPYNRETYRYTPLLAWFLVPTSWGGVFYHFGKFLFMTSDIITGILITRLLQKVQGLTRNKILILSAIWLLNPMVITISTRGSSESVLSIMIMLSIYYLMNGSNILSAIWLGIAIHFKIYPVIYLPSMLLYLTKGKKGISEYPILRWINKTNLMYFIVTILSLGTLNYIMYSIYGYSFLYHSYLYHLTRIDHRHNFSVYNIALYYKSTLGQESNTFSVEKYALVPQLLLTGIILPCFFARKDIISTLFIQTFTFVTFNKVMTSQYFIWFLIFLPHYLSRSQLIAKSYVRGILVLISWVLGQTSWLFFAYKLEFLGESTFDNGLLYSACLFFLINCWILGVFIDEMQQLPDFHPAHNQLSYQKKLRRGL